MIQGWKLAASLGPRPHRRHSPGADRTVPAPGERTARSAPDGQPTRPPGDLLDRQGRGAVARPAGSVRIGRRRLAARRALARRGSVRGDPQGAGRKRCRRHHAADDRRHDRPGAPAQCRLKRGRQINALGRSSDGVSTGYIWRLDILRTGAGALSTPPIRSASAGMRTSSTRKSAPGSEARRLDRSVFGLV